VDAGQLQRGAFEVHHAAILRPLQRQRNHVGPEQRLERRIGVVALRRHPGLNAVGLVGIASDEGESRIAAAELAVDGLNHAGASSMNSMKFNLV
jgi:hypothetical protein